MLKKPKVVSLLVLLCYSFSPSVSASEPTNAVQRIREIMDELEQIQQQKDSYLTELENTNSEKEIEIQQRLKELEERESELNALKTTSNLLGDLIDDQAIYTRKLEKKLVFWKTTSLVLSVSLLATIGTTLVITQPWK